MSISVGGEMNVAVNPASRAPIVDPMSNMVMNVARATALCSTDTLSLRRAVEGATRIPQPTPYKAIIAIRRVELSV